MKNGFYTKQSFNSRSNVFMHFLKKVIQMFADHYGGTVHIGANHVLHECILTLAQYAVEDLDKNARGSIAKGHKNAT